MLNKITLKDTSGNKSVTVTAFVVGFALVNLKLLVSGMELFGQTMEVFTGTSYSMAMAALGGIYVMRRATTNTKPKGESK